MPASAAPINNFAGEQTKGLIEKLVDAAQYRDPMTTASLLNAVYFKGTWLTQFAKGLLGRVRAGSILAPSGEKQVDLGATAVAVGRPASARPLLFRMPKTICAW